MPREQGGYDTEAVADIHDRFERKKARGLPTDVARDDAVEDSAATGHEIPPENVEARDTTREERRPTRGR